MSNSIVLAIILASVVVILCLWAVYLSRQTVSTILGKERPIWIASMPYYGVAIILLALGWLLVEINGWQSHALNWLNLLVRWAHVVIGIAWIGASFYFVFLENSLNRVDNVRDELAGNLWAIHGGGFYYLEKYKNAPKTIPKKLHWFKYEAYFTWITGFVLLIIVYYSKAEINMVGRLQLAPWLTVVIAISSLVIGWFFYDLLCRSIILKKPLLFFVILFLFTALAAFVLSELLSPKAAYIHVGAMLGTMMAGNVFRVIIPSQKALVGAAGKGQVPDPGLGKHASMRSLHNNYFTLPVVFIMLSNHFPSTFGHPYNWAILSGIILFSVGFRHFLNLQEQGNAAYWIIPAVTLGVLVLAFITAPKPATSNLGEKIDVQEVMEIFKKRCNSCHSVSPIDSVWVVAPNGVVFDHPAQIAKMQDQIMLRVVNTETMPLANVTGMTPEEREIVSRWILQGAVFE